MYLKVMLDFLYISSQLTQKSSLKSNYLFFLLMFLSGKCELEESKPRETLFSSKQKFAVRLFLKSKNILHKYYLLLPLKNKRNTEMYKIHRANSLTSSS